MLIAHVTDLHCLSDGLAYGRVDTAPLIERAAEALAALDPRPDLVVVTGDLTDDGDPRSYAAAARFLAALKCPVRIVPGNHDSPEHFRALTEALGYPPPRKGLVFAEDYGAMRVIGLDSSLPFSSRGGLSDETLDFLEAELAAMPERPTLIAVHHPPFACGVGFMDRVRLVSGAERFERILAASPQVLALLCGHHHRAMATMFGGRLCLVTPAIAHQVGLDLRAGAEGGYVMEPPAFRLLRYDGTRLVSHLAYVDAFGGRQPFRMPAPDAQPLAS